MKIVLLAFLALTSCRYSDEAARDRACASRCQRPYVGAYLAQDDACACLMPAK